MARSVRIAVKKTDEKRNYRSKWTYLNAVILQNFRTILLIQHDTRARISPFAPGLLIKTEVFSESWIPGLQESKLTLMGSNDKVVECAKTDELLSLLYNQKLVSLRHMVMPHSTENIF